MQAASPYFTTAQNLQCSCFSGIGRGDGRARCILDDLDSSRAASPLKKGGKRKRKPDDLHSRVSRAYSKAPTPAQPTHSKHSPEKVPLAKPAESACAGDSVATGPAPATGDGDGGGNTDSPSPATARTTSSNESSKLGIIIGQAPGPKSVGSVVPPLPFAGKAELRLARLAGLSVDELWNKFDRINLLTKWLGFKPVYSYGAGAGASVGASVGAGAGAGAGAGVAAAACTEVGDATAGASVAATAAAASVHRSKKSYPAAPRNILLNNHDTGGKDLERAHGAALRRSARDRRSKRTTTSPYFRKQWKGGGPGGVHSPGDKFPIREARERARLLQRCIRLKGYKLVVVLGGKVASAFGYTKEQAKLLQTGFAALPAERKTVSAVAAVPEDLQGDADVRHDVVARGVDSNDADAVALVLPHPSGVSHYWNSPENISNASAVFRQAIRDATA